jgi:hypothetical protein
MPEAVSPAHNVDGTALGRKPKSEATVPTWVLRVIFQNLASHERALYFGHRKLFRETLVVPVQRNLIGLFCNLVADE